MILNNIFKLIKNIFFIIDNESVIRLCLRLPNGKKETVSMSTTDTVKVIIKFLLTIYLEVVNYNIH